MGKTDEVLIMEYLSGNIAALEEIFQRYKKAVFNFSLRILGNRADAEDVVGEVFLALSSHRYARREKTKFSTWLFTVAHNCSISRIRKKSRFQDLWFRNKENEEAEEWDIPDNRIPGHRELADAELAGQIKEAVERLPGEQKEAIVLREYHDMNYEEISQVLQCSLEKVKVLIFRARENLRKELRGILKEVR